MWQVNTNSHGITEHIVNNPIGISFFLSSQERSYEIPFNVTKVKPAFLWSKRKYGVFYKYCKELICPYDNLFIR